MTISPSFPLAHICISNANIDPTPSAQNLGVVFDNAFTLKPHICKSSFFHIHRISRICRNLTLAATKTIVHSFVSSQLDYCNSVLARLLDCDICKLQSIQNFGGKLLTQSCKHDHVTALVKELHWLSVHLLKVRVLAYKLLYGLSPPYIMALLKQHVLHRALSSSSKFSLEVLKLNTTTYDARDFAIFTPLPYNRLP